MILAIENNIDRRKFSPVFNQCLVPQNNSVVYRALLCTRVYSYIDANSDGITEELSTIILPTGQNYTFSYFNRIPSVVNNTTNIYAQNEFYIGLNNTAPSILFKHKNGWMIGGGYDLIDNTQRIRIQGYYNLKLRK